MKKNLRKVHLEFGVFLSFLHKCPKKVGQIHGSGVFKHYQRYATMGPNLRTCPNCVGGDDSPFN
jgi:hypothetical protein